MYRPTYTTKTNNKMKKYMSVVSELSFSANTCKTLKTSCAHGDTICPCPSPPPWAPKHLAPLCSQVTPNVHDRRQTKASFNAPIY